MFSSETLGWRLSFAATAGLGVLAMAALWLALPAGERGRMPDVRAELRVLTRPVVLAALATTVLSAGAMFALYTYIAPFLQERTGASPGFVTVMLVLVGSASRSAMSWPAAWPTAPWTPP